MNAEDVEDILALFLSKEYFDKWIEFITDNSVSFSADDGVRKSKDSGNAYSLQQYEIFDQFTVLVENQLNNCCESLGFSSSEFYQTCKILSDSKNTIVEVFCTLVLSSTEFQLFADIMLDACKRGYFIQIIQSWRSTLKSHRK